ncbi:hypothetical protein EGR_02542 [Echinococcus granulosus]|uniref:Uncharacterized protein n=1 Tax=Echinococcus granulosus TaxID=6210 RepID=W6UPN3_ECHGR|nr:hypothetical protein EGR_02542 [Echinococcus granulosus]EUB62746.1 hypothetical protein EGR_02542 [Echinococcus granulosus]
MHIHKWHFWEGKTVPSQKQIQHYEKSQLRSFYAPAELLHLVMKISFPIQIHYDCFYGMILLIISISPVSFIYPHWKILFAKMSFNKGKCVFQITFITRQTFVNWEKIFLFDKLCCYINLLSGSPSNKKRSRKIKIMCDALFRRMVDLHCEDTTRCNRKRMLFKFLFSLQLSILLLKMTI